jgi:hypothetical protein
MWMLVEGKGGASGERAAMAEKKGVTTPSEIIPYYCLNHSIWSLSDNKEPSH